jgi:hypothetical protein
MDDVIKHTNVTKALTENGIEIVALLILTDNDVESLSFKDQITTKYPLKRVRLDSLKHSSILSIIVMKSITQVMINGLPQLKMNLINSM